MKGRVFVDRFDSTQHVRGKRRTYETVKEAALAAGRFSCFEASDGPQNQRWFTRLCHDDPDVETFDLGYPWTGVRRRSVATSPEKEQA